MSVSMYKMCYYLLQKVQCFYWIEWGKWQDWTETRDDYQCYSFSFLYIVHLAVYIFLSIKKYQLCANILQNSLQNLAEKELSVAWWNSWKEKLCKNTTFSPSLSYKSLSKTFLKIWPKNFFKRLSCSTSDYTSNWHSSGIMYFLIQSFYIYRSMPCIFYAAFDVVSLPR